MDGFIAAAQSEAKQKDELHLAELQSLLEDVFSDMDGNRQLLIPIDYDEAMFVYILNRCIDVCIAKNCCLNIGRHPRLNAFTVVRLGLMRTNYTNEIKQQATALTLHAPTRFTNWEYADVPCNAAILASKEGQKATLRAYSCHSEHPLHRFWHYFSPLYPAGVRVAAFSDDPPEQVDWVGFLHREVDTEIGWTPRIRKVVAISKKYPTRREQGVRPSSLASSVSADVE